MGKPRNFDEIDYLDLNPDVEAAVRRGQFQSGYEHWKKHGKQEGRPLSLTDLQRTSAGCPEAWDEARYLRANPDVAAAMRAGVFTSGYAHWTAHGEDEGRPGGLSGFQLADPVQVLQQKPSGINYFGFHSMKNGLASAARGYLELLQMLTPNVAVIDVPVWGKELKEKLEYRPDRLQFPINVIHQNPNMVPYFLHHYSQKTLQDHFNVGIWVWELHAGYPDWLQASRFFHEVWVPSAYVADSLKPVCAAPLIRVPYVVDCLPHSSTCTRTDLGWPQDAFVFLYVFDVASTLERKNPFALIHAFRRAFRGRKDVVLALKYHHASDDPAGVQMLENFAAASPNIRTISGTMSDDEVYSLFQLCDCFVSPHRSEGFGLNIAQAMYYGKPVIATGYSGNMDFTTKENSFLIDFNLIPLDMDYEWYQKGYAWADPSVEHLAVLLQQVVANPEEASKRAELGRRMIAASYNTAAITKCMDRLKLSQAQ